MHATEVSATLDETRKRPRIGTIERLENDEEFKGVTNDTCGYRTSFIRMKKYRDLCKKLNRCKDIRAIEDGKVNGIGGPEKGIGLVTIDIQLADLNIIFNVKLLMLSKKIPALLRMKDLITNGLNLSLQRRTITF